MTEVIDAGPIAASARRHAAGQSAEGATGRDVPAGDGRWHGDIQGLRGVAVLAVVAYHAVPGALPGGFIGVDIFYVISGFLITGMLWRELEQRGTISFRRFYARRIRRLLPMALVVLAATVIAADLLQSPLDAARTAKDALACALYVANYRFAFQQTNYLDASLGPSPLQHYWSLGVEEQMYLIWPVLLLLASGALLFARRRASARGAVALLLSSSIVSFLVGVRLTHSNEPWAFFSFPTRAWELGVGGLVAFAAPTLRTLPRVASWLFGLAGLGAIVFSALRFGATTPWPGTAAALPVLGAAAVIAAGCGRRPGAAAKVLSLPPLQFAGMISYSWYLWHWPVLILAPLVLKHPLSSEEALVLAGVSGLLATFTYFVIERPFHLSAWLAARARRGFSFGVVLTGAGVAVCAWSVAAVALPTTAPHSVHLPSLAPKATPGGANPYAVQLAGSTAALQQEITQSQQVTEVPDDLAPSLEGAIDDVPVLYGDGCVDTYTATYLNTCEYGNTTSSTSVVLFGDSHAAMWFPAVEQAADQFSWRLYAWTKDTCPPIEIDVYSPDLGHDYTECTTWRDEVLAQIAQLHPALVVLGMARHYSPIYGFTVYSSEWLAGLEQMVAEIRQMGSRVLVLGPIPKPAITVPNCLSENLETAATCQTLRGAGVDLPGMREEETAVLDAGGSYLNTLFWFCSTEAICPPIIDGILVYRDDNHITQTFADFLSEPVGAALELAETGKAANPSAVFLSPLGT